MAQPATRDSLSRLAVLDALALGQSVSAAARIAGVHRSTVYHWTRTDPQVARAVSRARSGHHSTIYDDVQELASRALSTVRETLDNPELSPSLRLRAALAVLKTATAPEPAAAPASDTRELDTAEFDTSVESVRVSNPAANTVRYDAPKPGRNHPCPCGSGRKYKFCCLNAQKPSADSPT